ncbi:trypsin-like serine protease [Caballeronia sp. S22]|uniref:nSTAND1 domain-containing NTPase n=1 Tax=Caballeronia sp. S22 TaxID=3137182 RepID=UPI0035307033
MISDAIGRLIVSRQDGTEARGTAFLVSDRLILTAFHVIGNRGETLKGGKPVLFPKASFELSHYAQEATLVEECYDAVDDWAMLSLTSPIPGIRPIPMGELQSDEINDGGRIFFKTWGFPRAGKIAGHHIMLEGRIQDACARFQDSLAFQLYSENAAADKGAALNGLSGAPCIVDGAAVGIIRANLVSTVNESGVLFGVIYACPLTADSFIKRTSRFLYIVDPLRGLPGLPRQKLPSKPFQYLHWYGAEHCEVYFGRSKKIRELFAKISGLNAPKIILVYGASGVGKSSLLASAVLPRLMNDYCITVARRNLTQTLVQTFENLQKCIEDEKSRRQKPAIFLLDQIEEVYTDPRVNGDQELSELAGKLFSFTESHPSTRIVLSFRSEWLAPIRRRLEEADVSYGESFIERMSREDVIEVVRGVSRTKRLREFYGVTVDPGLPDQIAGDLLRDPNSPIAPILSIIMTRLWEQVKNSDDADKRLTTDLYVSRMRSRLDLDHFLSEQLDLLAETRKSEIESGLILNILVQHTTELGTAKEIGQADLLRDYPRLSATGTDGQSILLTNSLISHSLLFSARRENADGNNSSNELVTRLAHDTLAPAVAAKHRLSNAPGQRAQRILESRVSSWDETHPREGVLDATNLKIVKSGLEAMRRRTEKEKALLKASESAVGRMRVARLTIAVALIIGAGVSLSFLLYPPIGQSEVFETPSGRFEHKAFWIFNNTWHYYYQMPKAEADEAQEIAYTFVESNDRRDGKILLTSNPALFQHPLDWMAVKLGGANAGLDIEIPISGCVAEGRVNSSHSSQWQGLFIIRKQVTAIDEFANSRAIDDTPSVYYHPTYGRFPEGEYVREGDQWVEKPPAQDGSNPPVTLTHREWCRDKNYIYLWDHTRVASLRTTLKQTDAHLPDPPLKGSVVIIMYVRIPLKGGDADWSYHNPISWAQMYPVIPASTDQLQKAASITQ